MQTVTHITRYKHIITTHGFNEHVVSEAIFEEVPDGDEGETKKVEVKPAVMKKETVTIAQVFPSINHAKRFNRLKLGGKAKVVHRRPANGAEHTQDNCRCDKEG